jgi:ferritin-like metal-binding protein YciE
MATTALRSLLVDELRDLLDAEKQLTRALPKMARAASAAALRNAFEQHLRQTEGHVARLERALTALDVPPRGKPCAGMKGLISEGQELIGELEAGPVRDAALVVAAQKVEHYEIAAYGSCKAFAALLGESGVGKLAATTLAEEKATDEKLTALAEGRVNPEARTARAGAEENTDSIFSQATNWIRDAVSTAGDSLSRSRPTTARRSRKSNGRTVRTGGASSRKRAFAARKK